MAVLPDPVHTRKNALLAEYGISPDNVAEYGFTDEYVDVLGIFYMETFNGRPVRLEHSFASDEVPRTRVYWGPLDVVRARDAIRGDFQEQWGTDATAQIDHLRAIVR